MRHFENHLNYWSKLNSTLDIYQNLKSISGLHSALENASLSGFKKINSLDIVTRSISSNPLKDLSNFYRILELSRQTNSIRKFIPAHYEDYFAKTVLSQQAILRNLSSISTSLTLKLQNVNQATILLRATTFLTSSIFTETIRLKKWTYLAELCPYYEKVVKITEVITEENEISNETIRRFECILQEIQTEIKVNIATNKKTFKTAFLDFLTILGFFLGIYSVYLTKSDISNEDVVHETKSSERHILQQVEKSFNSTKTYLDTLLDNTQIAKSRIACKLTNKPVTNSGVVISIHKGEQINVIDSCKKFYLVIYRNKNTNYPITGWVLKKHTTLK